MFLPGNIMRQSYKAFTMLEMIIVVVILGILFRTIKSVINTDEQNKKVFGETCINRIYGDLTAFKNDVDYGRYTWFFLAGGIPPQYVTISMTWFLANSRTRSWWEIVMRGYSGATAWTFRTLPLSAWLLPAECNHKSFTMAVDQNLGTGVLTTIPTQFAPAGQNRSIVPHGTTTNASQSVATMRACTKNWFVTGANPFRNVTKCLELGKIVIDRRTKSIQTFKCATLNRTTGLCNAWPSL